MVPGFHKRNGLAGSEARFRMDRRQTLAWDYFPLARHPPRAGIALYVSQECSSRFQELGPSVADDGAVTAVRYDP